MPGGGRSAGGAVGLLLFWRSAAQPIVLLPCGRTALRVVASLAGPGGCGGHAAVVLRARDAPLFRRLPAAHCGRHRCRLGTLRAGSVFARRRSAGPALVRVQDCPARGVGTVRSIPRGRATGFDRWPLVRSALRSLATPGGGTAAAHLLADPRFVEVPA